VRLFGASVSSAKGERTDVKTTANRPSVRADVRLVAVKDIKRGIAGISGSGKFRAGTLLYGIRSSVPIMGWHVWERNATWPWCVHVPDEFVQVQCD
jgi:hypothetical protein